MYLSKHQGGNSVSSAEQGDPNDRKRWKKDVLEAYLGVTLKRLFCTGPEAFEEIYRRLEQFTRSLSEQGVRWSEDELPRAVVETVTSLAFAIDAKDQYTQGHSQKVSAYARNACAGAGIEPAEVEEIRLAALLHDIGKVGIPEVDPEQVGPSRCGRVGNDEDPYRAGAPRSSSRLQSMARIRRMVRHHHEFYDGSRLSRPAARRRHSIRFARDCHCGCLRHDHVRRGAYKKPRTPEDAFAELERCAAQASSTRKLCACLSRPMRRAPVASAVPKEYKAHRRPRCTRGFAFAALRQPPASAYPLASTEFSDTVASPPQGNCAFRGERTARDPRERIARPSLPRQSRRRPPQT